MTEKNNSEDSAHFRKFDESINNERESPIQNKNESIFKCQEIFLLKKRKALSEEEKKKNIYKSIDTYCKRNDEMLRLLEIMNSDEITYNIINRMTNLLNKDLSDTKILRNEKTLISYQKDKLFERLNNLTIIDYQYFWYKFTDGKLKKGNALLIKSSNISKAKMIIKELEKRRILNENNVNINEEEKKKEALLNEKENSKKNKTIKEKIEYNKFRDEESQKIDNEILQSDFLISSEENLSLSLNVSDDYIDNNKKDINKNKYIGIERVKKEEKINNKEERKVEKRRNFIEEKKEF